MNNRSRTEEAAAQSESVSCAGAGAKGPEDDDDDDKNDKDKKPKLPNAKDLKMSETVKNHINDIIMHGANKGQLSIPFIDSSGTILLLQEIMESGNLIQDEYVSTALRWDVEGVFRGIEGI